MTTEERMEFLFQCIELHDRQLGEHASQIEENAIQIRENTIQIGENVSQIGEVTRKLDRLEDAIEKLVNVTNADATAIRTLARVAEAHERRLF